MTNWKQFLLKTLHAFPKNRDDVLRLLRHAEHEKIIDLESERMLEGVLQISQLRVRDIMLPVNDIISLHKKQTLPEIIQVITENLHSRCPVLSEDKQETLGILLAKDILRFTLPEKQARFDLNKVIQPAMIVPETQHLNRLLNDFKLRRTHMAIVVDEYGSIVGLVTMEDLLEQIVGDIEDESDYDVENRIKQHKDYWVVNANVPIDEFNAAFNINLSNETCDTIGGLVISILGYIPKRHEEIKINHFTFHVLNVDKRKIHLLRVIKQDL
jgi:magnesium and cobalt transporter